MKMYSQRERSNLHAALYNAVVVNDLEKATATGLSVTSVRQLGTLIRHLRHKNRLSQSQLARNAAVGRRLVSECEMGKETIRAGELLRVCAAVGLRLTPTEASAVKH